MVALHVDFRGKDGAFVLYRGSMKFCENADEFLEFTGLDKIAWGRLKQTQIFTAESGIAYYLLYDSPSTILYKINKENFHLIRIGEESGLWNSTTNNLSVHQIYEIISDVEDMSRFKTGNDLIKYISYRAGCKQ